MKIFPTEREIDEACDLLLNKYNISTQLLNRLYNNECREQVDNIFKGFDNRKIEKEDICRLVLYKFGTNLFGGCDNVTKELRRKLLIQLDNKTIKDLFERHNNKNNSIRSVSYMINPLVEKKWHSNGNWPNDFVKALKFPKIFAGVDIRNQEKLQTIEKAHPRSIVPELKDFQNDLKCRMLKVLKKEGNKTRCMITLPTGGGKTRVAVEAFIEWMMPRFSEGNFLIWVAQSSELCEQAVSCIKSLWENKEYVEVLKIYRYFEGREIPTTDKLNGGVIVANIHQLHNRIKRNDEIFFKILAKTGAMVIDEAHRAVSSMYTNLFDKAEKLCGVNLFPICGLSATPGRTGINKDREIPKLVDRFDYYLVRPNLGKEYESDPLKYFRDNKYLAKANHIIFKSGLEYTLTDKEIESIDPEKNDYIPSLFLKRLAKDKDRNLRIMKRLLKISERTSTLVYTCTVEHAELLCSIMNFHGRRSGVINSNTPIVLRRKLIEQFKENKLNFLFNFGVLTTGFDAPKTNCIVILRPTTSEVLYEQIIGRGLRGPEFGGTEECDIIDFSDNIFRLGPQMAYTRFADFWTEEKEEKE
jgi:DNA repair protein RadD